MGLIHKQANSSLMGKIEDWLKKYTEPECKYTIGDDMKINSPCISVGGFEGEVFPDYIQFGDVEFFYVGYCYNLRSCEGFPLSTVKIEISHCGMIRDLNFLQSIKCINLILTNLQIESLGQLPGTIKMLEVWCCDNLRSLKGCPQTLKSLVVRHNISLTLEDFPTNIDRLVIGNNPLIYKHTKQEIKRIVKTQYFSYY